MSRPGFVLEVDDKTPNLLTFSGAKLRLERFGLGARVAYPADPVASSDPVSLVDQALESPVGTGPLPSRLGRDTVLTIVVVDRGRPQPGMRFDVRRTIVERVLGHAARAGVDDVQIVIATGLNRRWTAGDVSGVLGDRVATSFVPDGLVRSHDVTDPGLVELGEVDGHPVRINARVAASDLVVAVEVVSDADPTCGFTSGLVDVDTINRMGGLGSDDATNKSIAELVYSKVPLFSIAAVLGQPLFGSALTFAHKREWEWRLPDQLSFAAARQFVAAMPKQGAQRLYGSPLADYAISDLIGGDPATVHTQGRDAWCTANSVALPGPADVLSLSVWGAALEPGNPAGSPVGAAHDALVAQAGSHAGTALVRDGGVVIARHPLSRHLSNRAQSAVADLVATVLPETIDPEAISERFEAPAMVDPWYLNLYREEFADHPLKAFHTWYRVHAAATGLADVIWVGADRRSAALLGHRAATTFADALEIAANSVGRSPAITHLHGPGRMYGVVG